jgi:hypothetical protein
MKAVEPVTLRTTIILCLLGAGLFSTGLVVTRNQIAGSSFLQLYSGARLVGTGQLYDAQANYKMQSDTAGRYGESLVYNRIPCFPFFMSPLARLPYATARQVWNGIEFLAIVSAVWLWPGSRRLAAIVTCFSLPLLLCVADGADTTFLWFWLALWRRLEAENRPVWSGMAIAMCIAKFHLFLLLPVLLLRHRRWRVIAGSAIGITALLAISFVVAGWHWPVDYIRVLTNPAINPGRAIMPNIHGFAPPALEIPAVIVTVILISVAIFRLDYMAGTAVTLIGCLLCSYHAYVFDGVMIIPAIVLLFERYRSQWPSYIAGILTTPIPWIAVLLRGLKPT